MSRFLIYTVAGLESEIQGVETTWDDALQAAREVADAEALEIRPRRVYVVQQSEDEVLPTPLGAWLGELENLGRYVRAVNAGERPVRNPWGPDGAITAAARRCVEKGVALGALVRHGDIVEPQTDVATAALSGVIERYEFDLIEAAQ